MAEQFKILKAKNTLSVVRLEKATATVFTDAGFPVKLDAGGLAVPAVSADTNAAVVATPAPAGQLYVDVYNDSSYIYEVVASAAFAKTDRSKVYNLLVAGAVATINKALVAAPLFTVLPDSDAGVVGSTVNVRVKINPLLG